MITSEDLTAIPEDHRHVVAQWLVERAGLFQPSFLLTEGEALKIRDVLQGAAVDLASPVAGDGTVEHANGILNWLAERAEVDPA